MNFCKPHGVKKLKFIKTITDRHATTDKKDDYAGMFNIGDLAWINLTALDPILEEWSVKV